MHRGLSPPDALPRWLGLGTAVPGDGDPRYLEAGKALTVGTERRHGDGGTAAPRPLVSRVATSLTISVQRTCGPLSGSGRQRVAVQVMT